MVAYIDVVTIIHLFYAYIDAEFHIRNITQTNDVIHSNKQYKLVHCYIVLFDLIQRFFK